MALFEMKQTRNKLEFGNNKISDSVQLGLLPIVRYYFGIDATNPLQSSINRYQSCLIPTTRK